MWLTADGAAPIVEEVRGKGWIGVRVDREHEVDVVGFRRVGARKDAGLEDAETDAALFCVTRNGEGTPVRAFMRAGTYLKGGESASLLSQTGDHHS